MDLESHVDVNLERYIELPDGTELRSTLTIFFPRSERGFLDKFLEKYYPDWCWVS